MRLDTTSYATYQASLPSTGRHVIAQYDDESIVVYQAYNHTIAAFAATNGHFGEGFRFTRMSWIKPNFLWMMYRCGWAEKDENQARVLALRLRRTFFDGLLERAVVSSYVPALYDAREQWQEALRMSDVRLQWDPDHDPAGRKLARRALQLGLSQTALSGFRGEALLGVEDITDFVIEQRPHAQDAPWHELRVPTERVYPVASAEARQRLGLDV